MRARLAPLSQRQRIIAWRLQTGRAIPRQELIDALWGDSANGGPLGVASVIKSLVNRLRLKLIPHGVIIKRRCGCFIVDPDHVAVLRDLLADEIVRATVGGGQPTHAASVARQS